MVVSFQTTAEAVLFLSPALFRNDPTGATAIMTVIASDANTQALASAMQSAWNEPHPLQDPNVSAAYTVALRSILTKLIQQGVSGGSAQTEATQEDKGSAASSQNLSNATTNGASSTVATSVSYHPIDVCCVSVDMPFTISNSQFTSNATVNGFNLLPTSNINVVGNAAGWVMRIVPLDPNFNPATLRPINAEPVFSANADSPGPVVGEDSTEVQRVQWIPGNSVLQYGDLYGDVSKIASSVVRHK